MHEGRRQWTLKLATSILHFLRRVTIRKMLCGRPYLARVIGAVPCVCCFLATLANGEGQEPVRAAHFADAAVKAPLPPPILTDNLLALDQELGEPVDWPTLAVRLKDNGGEPSRWARVFRAGTDFARAELAIHAQDPEILREAEIALLAFLRQLAAETDRPFAVPEQDALPLARAAERGDWPMALWSLYQLQQMAVEWQPEIRPVLWGGQWLAGLSTVSAALAGAPAPAPVGRLREGAYGEALLDDVLRLPAQAQEAVVIKRLEDAVGQVLKSLNELEDGRPDEAATFSVEEFSELTRNLLTEVKSG